MQASESIHPAETVAPAALHAAMTGAFADYLIGSFALPLAQWSTFLARHAVDLSCSRVAVQRGEVIAFALVAPRAELGRWRLATMGALPAARGCGAAPALLDDFIERAGVAGMRGVELECIAQNERALRLYQSRRFDVDSPLYGYTRAPGEATPELAPQNVEPLAAEAAYEWLDAVALRRADLPLQVTPVSLRALATPPVAWRHGDALLVFSEISADAVTVQSIVDSSTGLRDAEVLVRQLATRYASRRITVPQLQRPDIGGDAFERAGFERLPMHQYLMRRPL
ncbi:GNAT family N-acetyltransferase [Caenimonas koreensis]|uniref:GNAT family N-acetyltransferase n=1 Tax=Caenimonas koreensis TaxID=367474 RepID=UPI003782D892